MADARGGDTARPSPGPDDESRDQDVPRPGAWRRALHSLEALAAVFVVFYAVPAGEDWSIHAVAAAVTVLVGAR